MKPEENIERLIRKFEVATTEEMDKWVCDDGRKVIRQRKSAAGGLNMWRLIVKSRMGKMAAAAIMIVAIFTGVNYFGGPVGIATRGFAEMIAPFLEARTATFTIRLENASEPCSLVMTGMFAAPSRMRFETTGEGGLEMVNIIDIQKGKIVYLMPGEKTAWVLEMENMSVEQQRKADIFFDIREQLQQAREGSDEEVEFLGEREIDGMVAQGYLVRDELGIETAVWVDDASLLPVLIECDMSEMYGVQMKMIMSDFEFNVELDESLFSLEIPEGYTTQVTQIDASEALEKDLLEMLRVWTDATGGKFPSALSLNVEVLAEFSTASISWLGGEEDKEYPDNTEEFHQLLDEIKLDMVQLEKLIQGDENNVDAVVLSENIKEHLAELRQLKEEKEQIQRQRRDDFMPERPDMATLMNDIMEKMMPIGRGLRFVTSLGADSDWHYAGKNVEYGDAETAIFWYRPEGLNGWRVIYGDLSMKDVGLDEQPDEPEVLVEDAPDETKPPVKELSFTLRRILEKEVEFIEALEIWTKFMDGKFPASIAAMNIHHEFSDHQNERFRVAGELTSNRLMVEMGGDMMDIMNEIDRNYHTKIWLFARTLDVESDWRYAGRGVSVGDSDRAIFWYRPEGGMAHRVIYGDLTVGEMEAQELPADSADWQRYEDIHKETPKPVAVVEVASDPAAVEILERAQATYNALESYRSEIEVIGDYDAALVFDAESFPDLTQAEIEQLEQNVEFKKIFNHKTVSKKSLTMTLARPELYCIEWTTDKVSGGDVGCQWSDGNGYCRIANGKKKFHKQAYFGDAATVPKIFHNTLNNYFKLFDGLALKEDEVIEGEQCYVISGVHGNRAVRLWISKERLLILRREEKLDFEFNPGQTPHEMMIKRILAAMGEEVTPEAIELMRERMKSGFAKHAVMKGLTTEVHRDIILDEPVSAEDLVPSLAVGSEEE